MQPFLRPARAYPRPTAKAVTCRHAAGTTQTARVRCVRRCQPTAIKGNHCCHVGPIHSPYIAVDRNEKEGFARPARQMRTIVQRDKAGKIKTAKNAKNYTSFRCTNPAYLVQRRRTKVQYPLGAELRIFTVDLFWGATRCGR